MELWLYGGVILATLAGLLLVTRAKRPPRSPSSRSWSGASSERGDRQRTAVERADFVRQPLLNQEEQRIFRLIEEELSRADSGLRLMAQVSMGEFLAATTADGFHSINAKRVDFLVINAAQTPLVAVEHQGSGHYLGDAEQRDAIKRIALEKAAIALVETFPNDSDRDVRKKVKKALHQAFP